MSKLLNLTKYDILDLFPRLSNLGASSFGEDPELFGDTLFEVIEEAMKFSGRVCALPLQVGPLSVAQAELCG